MHRARVEDEVETRRRKSREELVRKQIALEAIAARTCEDDVAGNVSAAMRQRLHVVECSEIELEPGGAVDAAPAAVAHRSAFDGSFLMSKGNRLGAASDAWCARERHTMVELPTSGQCHLAKKGHPAHGSIPAAGRRANLNRDEGTTAETGRLASRS